MDTFVIFPLHFSPSSAFLLPFLSLSSGNPPILAVVIWLYGYFCYLSPPLFSFLCLPPSFPKSLFRQSSHLSCGLPHFLQSPCVFVSALFVNLSFHSDHVSSPFHPALNYTKVKIKSDLLVFIFFWRNLSWVPPNYDDLLLSCNRRQVGHVTSEDQQLVWLSEMLTKACPDRK